MNDHAAHKGALDPRAAARAARPLWIAFVVFLAPMMLSNILQSLSGTINSVFLGHMIGVRALAAATQFFPIMFFMMAFVIGLGAGASVLIGQAYGKGDRERVHAIAGASLALSLTFGIVIALLGGFFAGPLMAALQTPAWHRGRALARGRRWRLDAFAGLGYDGIRPFLKRDLMLGTLNLNIGMGLRWQPAAGPWLVGLDVRREWLGTRNEGPDSLGGGAASLRLGAGLRLGADPSR